MQEWLSMTAGQIWDGAASGDARIDPGYACGQTLS